MANKSDPMDLKQIITLHKNVVSNRQMGELLDISRNTVKSYIKQIRGSNYSLDELLAWSDRNRHPDKCRSRLLF
ncbi:MAG: HTH domain-containing protein [Prolixibacteraceae bacterium]|nr:HTH domain-containing protein [Prolixibacteraceae bacterium]